MPCRDTVELRQIGIQHYPLPTYDENATGDFGQRIGDILAHAEMLGLAGFRTCAAYLPCLSRLPSSHPNTGNPIPAKYPNVAS